MKLKIGKNQFDVPDEDHCGNCPFRGVAMLLFGKKKCELFHVYLKKDLIDFERYGECKLVFQIV